MEINQIGQAIETKEIKFNKKQKLQQASKNFEKIFLKMMLDKMWSKIEIFKGSSLEAGIWQDFFNDEIASEISENCDIGISKAIYNQIQNSYLNSKKQDNNG